MMANDSYHLLLLPDTPIRRPPGGDRESQQGREKERELETHRERERQNPIYIVESGGIEIERKKLCICARVELNIEI